MIGWTFLCVILLSFSSEILGKNQLKLLQTVFRHGDCAPEHMQRDFYPKDPFKRRVWYPVPSGGLTNIGKLRSYNLGEFYTRGYGDWLENARYPDVKFYSSFSDKTKMTAQLVAAALFRPLPHERWHESLKWLPTPLLSSNKRNSWLFYATLGMCSNFKPIMKSAETNEKNLVKYLDDHRSFYKTISQHAGYNGTYHLAYSLYTILTAQAKLGLKMPKWTEGLLPMGKLKEAAGMVFVIRGFNDELKKFGGGMWLKMWLHNIDTFLSVKNPKKRALFWSGYDHNVADILVALDAFDEPHVPPFNSAVLFELREVNEKFHIKVLYKRNNYTEPLIVLGCSHVLCPLETFRRGVARILPEDADKTCGRKIIPR